MKLKAIFLTALITACSSDSFSEKDLTSLVYQGYWAMTPVGDIHRVLKFHPNGTVKIYEYSCDAQYQSYKLEETHTHYLRKTKDNIFTVLDDKQKPFAQFTLRNVNSQQLQATQYFLDPKIEPRRYQLSYTHQIGAKPICDSF
ncbi:hypothetical protein ACWIUA_10260 [Ursidibacter sp. B-7004-1]